MTIAKKLLILAVLNLLLVSGGFAQLSSDAKISQVNIRYENDKILVPYTIINSKASDRYMVWVEFYNENNQLMKSKSIKGDIDMITGAGQKNIVWDANF